MRRGGAGSHGRHHGMIDPSSHRGAPFRADPGTTPGLAHRPEETALASRPIGLRRRRSLLTAVLISKNNIDAVSRLRSCQHFLARAPSLLLRATKRELSQHCEPCWLPREDLLALKEFQPNPSNDSTDLDTAMTRPLFR